MDLFKNACRIHTGFAVNRYLMSNAAGRQCVAEKAQRHMELCSFYVATFFGGDPELVPAMHSEAYETVHSATQALTDYLDERIGFPLNSRPDYEQLAPLFFEEFHSLAVDALRGHVACRPERPDSEPCNTKVPGRLSERQLRLLRDAANSEAPSKSHPQGQAFHIGPSYMSAEFLSAADRHRWLGNLVYRGFITCIGANRSFVRLTAAGRLAIEKAQGSVPALA